MPSPQIFIHYNLYLTKKGNGKRKIVSLRNYGLRDQEEYFKSTRQEPCSVGSARIAELCERVLMAKLVESIRLGRVEL